MNPESLLTELGITFQCSAPACFIEKAGDYAHPRLKYALTMLRNNKHVWTGPFTLGTAGVKLPLYNARFQSFLTTLQLRPYAVFSNHTQWAAMYQALATEQKIRPKPADVVHCLLMDGSAHFDAQTFEDWCADLGMDTDSRKAEAMYRECDATGKAFARAFTAAELSSLREAFQDY